MASPANASPCHFEPPHTLTLQQAFAAAIQHHQAGRLQEAEVLYRQILLHQPQHADALQFLGVIASQMGQHQAAAELMEKAAKILPSSSGIMSNLGEVYRKLGRYENAIAAFSRALALDPGLAPAWCNLGVVFREQGRLEEAVAAYRRALQLQPENADFSNNLGVALSGMGRVEEAVEAYQHALRADPNCARIHNNLGSAFCLLGRFEEGLGACQRAVELNPSHKSAHTNLAVVFIELGRIDDAVQACRRALQIDPNFAEAHEALGHALKDQGRIDESVASYRRAVELKLDSASMLSNWVYAAYFQPAPDAAELRKAIAAWEARHSGGTGEYANDPDPVRRLRIGYISPDFRDHVIGRNLLPLFENHDRTAFELICYSGAGRTDAFTEKFKSLADRWRPTVGIGDEQLAAMIQADGIDLLVDLAQHMAGNRLPVFARRPAPVLASFAGYPDTTGLASIPERITDRYLEPHGLHEGERLWPLESFWCYDPCGIELEVNAPPVESSGVVTFGCLNNFCKVTDPVLECWARILVELPASRLLILSRAGSHRQRVTGLLQSRGVEPDRVQFAEPCPRAKYLALYHQVDLSLDTFPYNGHTTSLDSLWMGVPVVSLFGERPVSRAGLSILTHLGLAEFATDSADEYVTKAVSLARNRQRLRELRAELRDRMKGSVLMDAAAFARSIEAAYRGMWQAWCASRQPAP